MPGGTNMAQLPGLPTWGQGWLESYIAQAGAGDVVRGDMGRGGRWWNYLFDGVATLTEGKLQRLQDRIGRQVDEIGTAFRLPGDSNERPWPLSALPLLIGEDEWRDIADGVVQRADLLERLLADIYGEATLVASMANCPRRSSPDRAFLAIDDRDGAARRPSPAHLCGRSGRGPDGEWRVLADHVRAPAGAGYALENRLASSRVMGTLQTRLNLHRLAPFFASFPRGHCGRVQALRSAHRPAHAGPLQSIYPEQAHLARYLGMLLVEGDDLAVRDGRAVRPHDRGAEAVDALWRRMDSRFSIRSPSIHNRTSACPG
jgi:uncharacterized circularly permuted ATP-grasp superfamily protein